MVSVCFGKGSFLGSVFSIGSEEPSTEEYRCVIGAGFIGVLLIGPLAFIGLLFSSIKSPCRGLFRLSSSFGRGMLFSLSLSLSFKVSLSSLSSFFSLSSSLRFGFSVFFGSSTAAVSESHGYDLFQVKEQGSDLPTGENGSSSIRFSSSYRKSSSSKSGS